MLQLPPMPAWDSMHPMIIHFPIVLLLLSPMFVLISAILSPPKGKPYMVSALQILLLGAGSLFFAGSTGHSAAGLAERGEAVDPVLEAHEDLASETQIVFAGLSAILSGMYFIPRLLKRQENRLFSTFLPLAFLVLYTAGFLFLVIHEFSIHAVVLASSALPGVPETENATADRGKVPCGRLSLRPDARPGAYYSHNVLTPDANDEQRSLIRAA
jgi:uncharacterized membrane protein